jgi:hypothetical protein
VPIYRVTVRGRFDGLDDDTRAALVADAEAHDALTAAFTKDGTFVYDMKYGAFSYRYEVRTTDDEDDHDAVDRALARATADLARRGIPHRDLRAKATDMASMWERQGAGDKMRRS